MINKPTNNFQDSMKNILHSNIKIRKRINYVVTNNSSNEAIVGYKSTKIAFNTLRQFYSYILLALILTSFAFVAIHLESSDLWVTILVATVEITLFLYLFIDYVLWMLSYSYRKKAKPIATILFPFTIIGIVLLLGMLPSLYVIDTLTSLSKGQNIESLSNNDSIFQFSKNLIFLRTGRIMLLLTAFGPFKLLVRVFKKEWKTLTYVFAAIIMLILLFAVIILNAERNANSNLNTYWDAIYFTTISVVTIGYGDISPVTEAGRAMVIILSLVGIALFAIPSGVIASSYLASIQDRVNSGKSKSKNVGRINIEKIRKNIVEFFYGPNYGKIHKDKKINMPAQEIELEKVYDEQIKTQKLIIELQKQIADLKEKPEN
ncbi:voltage-gated potassium channel [Mycoplasma testudineum]|uniref:Voltage-gated potassium channel n=1 Tax=Mycoplasma testudineum TaxID=244584 RepID=A0A4R6IBM4_9MOLU|nr:potassium channel family protein [Mycoplasma testudineum]OYD26466.1 hypothetical protein CG473_03700 [Mycoplasma testudineum]TDO18971.1 voltage-gated potassium channel [Mycoplasma testudineum]